MATAYAVLADLTNYGVASVAAFGSLSSTQQQKALDAANALADSYFGGRYKLPITVWADDVREAVVAIARFKLLTQRGVNPDASAVDIIVEAYRSAIKWFEGIADGSINPVLTDSSSGGNVGGPFVEQGTSDPRNAGAFVVGKPSGRGW